MFSVAGPQWQSSNHQTEDEINEVLLRKTVLRRADLRWGKNLYEHQSCVGSQMQGSILSIRKHPQGQSTNVG